MAVVPYASIPTQPKPTAVVGAIPGANVPQAPSSTPTIPGANIPQPPQFDESYRNKDWTEQLKMFQSDPDLAGHEYQRAMNAANLYKATGNTDAYNKAQTWLGQIQTATGGRMTLPKAPTTDPAQQQYEQYQNQLNDLMGQLKSFAQPMQYNPATDPQAIAYKQYYDNLAKQGSQNAMEEMNSRGLLNSSMTAGEIAKAQQDANLAYGTKVADLGQQFYQRQQDQFNNTARLIGLLGDQQQRALDNQHWNQNYALQKQNQEFNQQLAQNQFDLSKKKANFDAANQAAQVTGYYTGPKEDWSLLYNTEGATPTMAREQMLHNNAIQEAGLTGLYNGAPTMQKLQMEQQAKQFAAQMGLDWAKLNQAQQQFLAEQALRQQAQNLELAKFQNANDPNSIDYQLKQAELKRYNAMGDNYEAKAGLNKNDFDTQRQAMVDQLRTGKQTPESALKLIDEDQQLGFYTPEQADQLRKTIYVLHPEYDPANIKAQQEKNKKLDNKFGYRMFGG